MVSRRWDPGITIGISIGADIYHGDWKWGSLSRFSEFDLGVNRGIFGGIRKVTIRLYWNSISNVINVESRIYEVKNGELVEKVESSKMVTSLDKTEEVMGHGVGDAVTSQEVLWSDKWWGWGVFGIPKIGYGRSGQMGSLVSSNRRLPYQALVEFGMGVQQRRYYGGKMVLGISRWFNEMGGE
ncbi:hypothetical protein IGI04_029816 [Brassica rapa subsp. trilocularis]|uniref:Bacterial surface antigen (D15) domain-containing protein n=1 Tax=Brassica rapa subsp. trilocularis TaxID=1813537 RepID=A0ABQ7LNW0_BRACM|nr:hypothetical protein IGI04_029816 [Brassica rapa subsp. trilocularis]